jgi:hypothetical protein
VLGFGGVTEGNVRMFTKPKLRLRISINKKINVRIREHESRSCNHFWNGKVVIITCSECVSLALGIKHAIHMRRVWSSMACPLVQ